MQRHVRLSLVDGRVVLVGFQEILLRDQHNKLAGPLTLQQAIDIFEAEPEPQSSTHLDVLRRQHGPARPPRPADD